ncbi:MAG: aa3-type cytochrome oxidase subunit II [Nocardioides sp.]
MGSDHRAGARPLRRAASAIALISVLVAMSGCSAEAQDQWRNLAMPDPATEESQGIFDLWIWSWVAALAVGVLVWGLIFWVVFRYRRKSPDEIPVQTRYNLPLEIFYTIAPILMVIVLFRWTVTVQNDVLSEDPNPDHVVSVVGFKWSWRFNYVGEDAVEAPVVYETGTAREMPTLWLPVDESVEFRLHSPDVIHSFWVVGFLMKMDVVPGRANKFQVTPNTIGEFKGKCAELCGVSHSRMLFNVKVVSKADYEQHLRDLEDRGNTSEEPVLGAKDVTTQVGLDDPEAGDDENHQGDDG